MSSQSLIDRRSTDRGVDHGVDRWVDRRVGWLSLSGQSLVVRSGSTLSVNRWVVVGCSGFQWVVMVRLQAEPLLGYSRCWIVVRLLLK